MERRIPVHAGNISEQLPLIEAAPAWEPSATPAATERIALSGRVQLPDPDEARAWAMAAFIGGILLTVAVDMLLLLAALLTSAYRPALVIGAVTWLIPPGFYLCAVAIRFLDRRGFDHRVREAMPPARPRVEVRGAVITANRVDDAMPERVQHLHKLMTLAAWAASEERDADGNIVKPYGAAPRLRRDGKGRRELKVKATGHIIRMEEQQQLNDELKAVGIFQKYPDGWKLADPTWTLEDVISRMKAAFPNEGDDEE